jgi:hypothetical protein
MDYIAFKNFVGGMIAPGSDSLSHVHGGMAVLLLARLITRRSLATPIPLAFVIVFELLNESIDRYNHGSWRWPDTIGDMINTVFWPVVLFVGLRLRRQREPSAAVSLNDEAGDLTEAEENIPSGTEIR